MALNTPGMGMPWGQPFTQYWQLVQGMLGRLARASRAWATTACSWAERGLNSFMVAKFCSICSKVDMPESTVMIPSREAAKRSAQEGRFFSGAAAFSTWATVSGGNLAQQAALDRLHDDNRLVVLAGHLVAPAGLDVVVLPVRVVDLQLDELHLRVLGKQLVQHVGLVVEGEAHVLEQALLLHLQGVVPNAELVKGLGAVVAAVVQQVEVEIPGTGAPQRGLQHLLGLAGGLGSGPGGQLGGQLEAFPGVPVHQSGFYSLLGFAPPDSRRRVKSR